MNAVFPLNFSPLRENREHRMYVQTRSLTRTYVYGVRIINQKSIIVVVTLIYVNCNTICVLSNTVRFEVRLKYSSNKPSLFAYSWRFLRNESLGVSQDISFLLTFR